MTTGYINIPAYGSASWKSAVATSAALPSSGNTIGDARVDKSTQKIYIWSGSAWVPVSGGGGGGNAFGVIQTPSGTSPTATTSSDTLNFSSSDSSVTITGNSGTKTVDFVSGIVPIAKGGFGLSGARTAVATVGNIPALSPATTFLDFTSIGTKTVQGMVSNGTTQRVVLRNTGASPLVVVHQSGSATAANRFDLEAQKDLTIVTSAETEFMYNTGTSRWNVKEIRNQVANDSANNLFSLISGVIPATANNVILGNRAIGNNTYGGDAGVIIGFEAAKNSSGAVTSNVIIGTSAGFNVQSPNNIIIGNLSGASVTTGSGQVLMGQNAGGDVTTGGDNIAIGRSSLNNLTTGQFNIGIGLSGGIGHLTGDANICIGQASGSVSATNLSNTITIGQQSRVTSSNQGNIGSSSVPLKIGINNSNPAYTLDVAGDVNTIGVYRINGVVLDAWTTTGNSATSPSTNFIGTTDIQDFVTKTNSTEVYRSTVLGLTGFQKTVPTAVIHAGLLSSTVADSPSLTAAFHMVPSTGYSFGSGNKNYSVYGSLIIDGTTIYSATAATTSFVEPAATDLNVASGTAVSQNGSGYDPNVDSPPSYEVWALYSGDTAQSPTQASFITDGGSWSDFSTNKDVGLTWVAPIISGLGSTVSSYYIVRNATDFQTVAGNITNLLDQNSGWTAGTNPGLAGPFYQVDLQSGIVAFNDHYRFLNTTYGTFNDTASTADVDDSTWASGSTVTPSSYIQPGIRSETSIEVTAAGYGLKIKEGSNAKMGTAALVTGTATVSNTSVTSSSRIFVTANSSSTAHGSLWVENIVASTSFDIKSTNALDDATVAYLIIEAI